MRRCMLLRGGECLDRELVLGVLDCYPWVWR